MGFDNVQDLYCGVLLALKFFKEENGWTEKGKEQFVWVEDRFKNPTKSGYRDVHMLVKVGETGCCKTPTKCDPTEETPRENCRQCSDKARCRKCLMLCKNPGCTQKSIPKEPIWADIKFQLKGIFEAKNDKQGIYKTLRLPNMGAIVNAVLASDTEQDPLAGAISLPDSVEDAKEDEKNFVCLK